MVRRMQFVYVEMVIIGACLFESIFKYFLKAICSACVLLLLLMLLLEILLRFIIFIVIIIYYDYCSIFLFF
jgi:hypothetical protein